MTLRSCFNLVARERVSAVLEKLKKKFATAGAAMGKGIGGAFGAAVAPAMAVATVGVAAGAVSAGLAVKAFSAAAGPQLDDVAEAWTLYDQAQKAAAEGGEEAVAAQKAMKEHMAGLPPATRATATAFIGLKKDFGEWSDSLSTTTMPVFTKGIGILRDLLPTLTPFVKAAAGAIGGFLDDVAVGVKSAGFRQWASDMSAAAGPALSNFLQVIKNLGVGFGGLMQAFLPASAGMTGGLVSMTAAFANWGTGLQNTAGFQQFLDMASTGGGALASLAGAALNLLVALSPLFGTAVLLANGLARVVSAMPPTFLTGLAAALVTVKLGMIAYNLVTALVAAKNTIMALSMTPVILGWIRMNAVGVAAMLRIAATATFSAAVTAAAWVGSALVSIGTWIAAVVRASITAVARFALMAARAIAWAAIMAAQWLIAMGPIGWVIAIVIGLVVLIIANWDKIRAFTGRIWSWVTSKISSAINSAKTAVSNAISRIGGYISGIKGRVGGALSGAGRWLLSAGRNIVQGLIDGIKGMIGGAVDAVKSGLSSVRNLLPFSPAKEGPFSGKGWTLYSGQALMQGLADGISQRQGMAASAMASATRGITAAAPGAGAAGPRSAPAPLGQGAGAVVVSFDFGRGEDDLTRLLRKAVRVRGRGNVQVAFGTG